MLDQPLPGLSPRHPLTYALNFALEEQRESLAAIWLLTHEMNGLSLIAEPQIAAVKLPWWHEELQRWQQKDARHPTMCRLQHLAEDDAVVSAVRTLFAWTVRQQTNPRCDDEGEFWRRCESHGMGLGVVSEYLATDQPALRSGYHSVGAGAVAIERLMAVNADARGGRIMLPLEWVAAAGLDTAKLGGEALDSGFLDIRRRLATGASERLRSGVDQINNATSLARHRYALVMAALYEACAEMLMGPDPMVRWPAPFRQLWRAWQIARRAH